MNESSTGKKIGTLAVLALVMFLLIQGGSSIYKNMTMTKSEKAQTTLKELLKSITVDKVEPVTQTITDTDILSKKEELPPIDDYKLTVEGKGEINIEIFASPEKAGEDKDGWINEIAQEFNASGTKINGKTVSVSIRPVSSGLAVDYITSNSYVPDAFTPSNSFWGEMIKAEGVTIEEQSNRLVGNVAGILLSEDKYKKMVDKYGSVNLKIITDATAKGDLAMGYTNPFVSSTGLNFLVSTLYNVDSSDPLSDKAVKGFTEFQKNVPLVSYNTLQMRKAAQSGSLDAFIMEYQSYQNDSTLKRDYVFTPFGIRHDNPMYAIGDLSEDKKAVLKEFTKYCLTDSSQKLATGYGFNQLENYKSELPSKIEGDTLLDAQKLYKDEKDTSKKIMAVFVADISGSMDGEPLNALKTSLINSMQYINSDNSIGVVSYNNDVYINLPIGKFDLNQQAKFKGAVNSLSAEGSTATFDAIAVALDMIEKAKKDDDSVKPMLFLLSDGEQNAGYSLDKLSPVLKEYKVPVYTIGYNANVAALQKVSDINEAATINAGSEDIVYQLKNLFNSQM